MNHILYLATPTLIDWTKNDAVYAIRKQFCWVRKTLIEHTNKSGSTVVLVLYRIFWSRKEVISRNEIIGGFKH